MMAHWNSTITAVSLQDSLDTVKFAMMFSSGQGPDQFIHKIIYIHQLHLRAAVIYLNRQIVGDVVAEGCHGTVIIRPAPFSEKIREAIHKYLRPGLFRIIEEEFLPCLLALAIFPIGITPHKSGLDRAGKHHRAFIAVLLESIKQGGSKAEIALHKLLGILRAVHPGKIEDKVTIRAKSIQLLRRRVHIIFIHCDILIQRIPPRLAFSYIAQLGDQVTSYEPLRPCN